VDRRDARGNPALHYATGDAAAAVVRILLRAGADLRARNRAGHTARDIADDTVEHLLTP